MKRAAMFPALTTILLLGLAGMARADDGPTAPGYEISWWTIDGGGAAIGEGDYTLAGTIGQPDAGEAPGGGGYTLSGGFWALSAVPPDHTVYLPMVLREE